MNNLGNGVLLVTRAEWDARAPLSRTNLTPSFGTTTHWEGPHMGDFDHSECAGKVRGIQKYHMDTKGWVDIAYTALTCPHGYVFEGRWVGTRTAANGTTEGNDSAYAVCYLGGEGDSFTDAAKTAQATILDWLDIHGGAGPGRNCHRDWKSTECPGDTICSWVKAGQPFDPMEGDGWLMALTDGEQDELLRKVREVWNATAANPENAADCRLKDTTIIARNLRDGKNLLTEPARSTARDLNIGSLVTALREPVEGGPATQGDARQVLKDLVYEVLVEFTTAQNTPDAPGE